MTLVIALQLFFPLLGISYLVSAWRHRHERFETDAEPPSSHPSLAFHRELLVRWDDVRTYDRCLRAPRRVASRARRSRMVFERVPSRAP